MQKKKQLLLFFIFFCCNTSDWIIVSVIGSNNSIINVGHINNTNSSYSTSKAYAAFKT